MTITTRSKRVSIFDHPNVTPAAVGPGAYAPEKVRASFKPDVRPLHAGFATSEKRQLNENKTTSAFTPGPGAYGGNNDQHSSRDKMSNVFVTKISRFAPSAPGSTVYMASSVQENPGPGSYIPIETHTSSNQNSGGGNNDPKDTKSTEPSLQMRFARFVKPSAPTIPHKDQSYGYVQVGGELRHQLPPSSIYSGIGQDTVGPAAYNHHEDIWDEKKNVAASIKSTVKREVWEKVLYPRRIVPGPGHYSPRVELEVSSNQKQKQSAVFASKVPILPTSRRVEIRDDEKAEELLVKDQKLQEKLQQKAQQAIKVEAFGSTSGRAELFNTLDTPFRNPTCLHAPGPGCYAGKPTHAIQYNSNGFPGTSLNSRRRKKVEDIGFVSGTERECLSKTKVNAAPGPGAYRTETPRMLRKYGRRGVFGTTSERHIWEHVDRVDLEELTPGPGAYEKPEQNAGHFPQVMRSAAFKSTSNRFSKFSNPQATPHVYRLEERSYMDPVEEAELLEASRGAVSAGAVLGTAKSETAKVRAPFLSTGARSELLPRDTPYLPGPGAYVHASTAELTPRKQSSVALEQRFKLKPHVPEHLGPGAYSLPDTLGSKSFNVTMAAPPPRDKSKSEGSNFRTVHEQKTALEESILESLIQIK